MSSHNFVLTTLFLSYYASQLETRKGVNMYYIYYVIEYAPWRSSMLEVRIKTTSALVFI